MRTPRRVRTRAPYVRARHPPSGSPRSLCRRRDSPRQPRRDRSGGRVLRPRQDRDRHVGCGIVEEAPHDVVDPLVCAEAAEPVAGHRADGHDVVVVSVSGAKIVAAMIGATHSVGTEVVSVRGRHPGEMSFHCHSANKATAVREQAGRNGYDLTAGHAYSDSGADPPMLEAAGHPAVVNPDRGLRRPAAERAWPVLTFSEPVSPRSRSSTAVAAIGIGAVATAGAAWCGLHRMRRR
ncbi:haloacid dehalogenase-like hydrolase [Actinokineospora spheciospongiae]|uniref:haloacid dehalogenase-like hydrolase n=1 Tax=Actinokineospora spheciospongiae TaxID=909613 RepID=UPI0015E84A40|nr:haloacid dehalogenase-like hydrolase [Actinokineospora spheciospongiae]